MRSSQKPDLVYKAFDKFKLLSSRHQLKEVVWQMTQICGLERKQYGEECQGHIVDEKREIQPAMMVQTAGEQDGRNIWD